MSTIQRARFIRQTGVIAEVNEDPEPPPPVDPLAALSDNFSGSSLDPDWLIYKPAAVAETTVGGGNLFTRPVDGGNSPTGSLWYNAFTGYLIYKLITGNFDMVAVMAALNAAGDGPPVIEPSHWLLAGISAHDPASPPFNYVHCAFGSVSEDQTQLVAEWKDCVDSVSPYGNIPWPSGAGQLRLLRVGQLFTTYARLTSSDSWTVIRAIDRTANPLPAELQVGMMVYDSAAGPANVSGRYDSVTFSTP